MPVVLPMTPDEFLITGLRLLYTERRIFRVKGDVFESLTNHQRFKAHFGASHIVVAKIWEDLQTTGIEEARIHAYKVPHFLEALNFNYGYRTEVEREAQFDKSPKTLRKWAWYYLRKIQALKAEKILFPEGHEFEDDDVFALTVDGTHCLWNEPTHPEFSQDSKACSHKFKHAALGYELGIHLYQPRLVWMYGSFYGGKGDNKNFEVGGLRGKLHAIGKKALGDKAYNGYPDECSTFNAFDDDAVKELKARAQMRHEQFNGMLKEFSSLKVQHRHSQEKFEVCFEAACVVCQYRMEHGEPLFDVLAGIDVESESDAEVESLVDRLAGIELS